ncbi:MAG: hypothetical protein Q3972_02430 [Corynebacterium sp.]|nr:hypothetical protein [Corynebacterium sp.]
MSTPTTLPVRARITLLSASTLGFLGATLLSATISAHSTGLNLIGIGTASFYIFAALGILAPLFGAIALATLPERATESYNTPTNTAPEDSFAEGAMVLILAAELVAPTALLAISLNANGPIAMAATVFFALWTVMNAAYGMAMAVRAKGIHNEYSRELTRARMPIQTIEPHYVVRSVRYIDEAPLPASRRSTAQYTQASQQPMVRRNQNTTPTTPTARSARASAPLPKRTPQTQQQSQQRATTRSTTRKTTPAASTTKGGSVSRDVSPRRYSRNNEAA